MPLITATELKASREAVKAGVTTVTDAHANEAIAEAEALIYQSLGYRVEVTETTFTLEGRGDVSVVLPQRARTVTSVSEAGVAITPSSQWALGADGWVLRRPASWWLNGAPLVVTGTFGFEVGHRVRTIATSAVKKLAVHLLKSTEMSGIPSLPAGARLTGFSSEQAQFTMYYDPSGPVDELLDTIRHPFRSEKMLHSVPIVGRTTVPGDVIRRGLA